MMLLKKIIRDKTYFWKNIFKLFIFDQTKKSVSFFYWKQKSVKKFNFLGIWVWILVCVVSE